MVLEMVLVTLCLIAAIVLFSIAGPKPPKSFSDYWREAESSTRRESRDLEETRERIRKRLIETTR